jgi:membrane protease YdiL (CAAX protease family)
MPASADSTLPPDDRLAAALRGFGPLSLLSFALIVLGNGPFPPLGALLALGWARLAGIPWRALGFVRPRRPWMLALGVPIGIVFKLVMKSVVMPLLGAHPINNAYHFLAHDAAALPGAIYTMVVGAGFGEETVFRGYLFERLGRLLGTSATAKGGIVITTALLFGLAHYPNQGLWGAEQAIITGAALGALFSLTGEIWLPMIIHAAFDLTALAVIYFDLETTVSHWFIN